ncbi:MAG: LicD family protein [Lachnospiraceae bacterium]|jgi:phosphorylcholine metabolism protein LicD|nr:LicD family protein [Lachnospiraceae bacterium]
MQFPDSFFEDQIRDGFYVPALMKRSWAAQMEVLDVVAQICKKHRIRWFADRGTLLGAVRHGGFIPWDDDLDICMLRDDYIRFNAVIRRELPQGFYVPESTTMGYRLLTRVCNGKSICVEKGFLERYHGFPFVAGIDIFALDYLSPDPEAEKLRKQLAVVVYKAVTLVDDGNQHTEQTEILVSQVEKLLRVKLDRSRSLNNQLFALLEELFGRFPASQAKEVAYMPNWIFDHVWKFPLDCYRRAVQLPFEHMQISVPVLYRDALRLQFGEHYMTPYRAGGGHDYPCHRPQMQQMAEALGEETLPFEYKFSPEDIERTAPLPGNRTDPEPAADQDNLAQFIRLSPGIHRRIHDAVQNREPDQARALLQICQENAIHTGTMLEQAYGEGIPAVALLEEYCDLVYEIYEGLETEDGRDRLGHWESALDSVLKRLVSPEFHA